MTDTVSSLLGEVHDLPDHESVRLLLAAAETDHAWMLGDPAVSLEVADRFSRYVDRRRDGEPVQYIEGSTQFGPIELKVDDRALIPRPETEMLWELAMGLIGDVASPIIVDLCTGSGNLALALKHSTPGAEVVAIDAMADAIALATANGVDLGLDVAFVQGDLFGALDSALRGRIDLIVSNPPYVSDREFAELPIEITQYEPSTALVAGSDGLEILRRIAAEATRWLRPGGQIACEIGETQGDAVRDLFAVYCPEIREDLTGRDRFVIGCAPMAANLH
jgi:release factor glutamine methyltransferase